MASVDLKYLKLTVFDLINPTLVLRWISVIIAQEMFPNTVFTGHLKYHTLVVFVDPNLPMYLSLTPP